MSLPRLMLPGSIVRSVSIAVIVTATAAQHGLGDMRRAGAAHAARRQPGSLVASPREVAADGAAALVSPHRSRPGAVVAISAHSRLSGRLGIHARLGCGQRRSPSPGATPVATQQEEVERRSGRAGSRRWKSSSTVAGRPLTSSQRLRGPRRPSSAALNAIPVSCRWRGLAGSRPVPKRLDGIEGELAAQQERGLRRLESGISRLHHGASLNGNGPARLRHEAAGRSTRASALASEGAGALAEALQKTVPARTAERGPRPRRRRQRPAWPRAQARRATGAGEARGGVRTRPGKDGRTVRQRAAVEERDALWREPAWTKLHAPLTAARSSWARPGRRCSG